MLLLPRSSSLIVCLLLAWLPQHGESYCWQMGYNPGFIDRPKVEQLAINKVRVSWKGIVKHRECADQFLVKYWARSTPAVYDTSDLVSINQNYVDIEVTPKITYQYQAVAREDKGVIRGIDWNKSPITDFKTSSYNKVVSETNTPAPEEMEGVEPVVDDAKNENSDSSLSSQEFRENLNESGTPDPYGREEIMIAGLTIEYFVGLVLLGLVLLLVLVGIVYKLATMSRDKDYGEGDDDDDDSSNDSDPDDQEEMAPEKNIP